MGRFVRRQVAAIGEASFVVILMRWNQAQNRTFAGLFVASLITCTVAVSTPSDGETKPEIQACKFQDAGIQMSSFAEFVPPIGQTEYPYDSTSSQPEWLTTLAKMDDNALAISSSGDSEGKICQPGRLTFNRNKQEMVAEWEKPKCPVSGYVVRLIEIGGKHLKLVSEMCNSSDITVPLAQLNTFSRYNISVQALLFSDVDKFLYSAPTTEQFDTCPQADPERATYIAGSVFPNGTAKLTWRSAEPLWPISYFKVTLCRDDKACKRPTSTNGSVTFSNLIGAPYSINITAVSSTEACGTRTSAPVAGHIHGKSIISSLRVKCLRDEKTFFAALSWKLVPEHIKILEFRPFHVVTNFYTSTNELHEEQIPVFKSWRKICHEDTGKCQITLPLTKLNLNTGYEFGLIARDVAAISYYAAPVPRKDCFLLPRVPLTRGRLTDKTALNADKLQNPDVQRVIQIDRDSFSSTDGFIEEAMIIIGASQLMKRGLSKREIYRTAAYNKQGQLLPLRITSQNWNIFTAWREANTAYEDPELGCSWLDGVHTGAALCVLGLEPTCTSNQAVESGCNVMLQANTSYGVILRGCTSAGCNDTEMALMFTGDKVPVPTEAPPTTVAPSGTSDTFMWSALQTVMVLIMCGGIVAVVAMVAILKWSERRESLRRNTVVASEEYSMEDFSRRPRWRAEFSYEELVNDPVGRVQIVRRVSDPL